MIAVNIEEQQEEKKEEFHGMKILQAAAKAKSPKLWWLFHTLQREAGR